MTTRATPRSARSPRTAVSALPTLDVARAGSRARLPPKREMQTWAAATLGRAAARSEISLLIVDPARSRRFNRDYRGQDKPTNVLSFARPPSPGGPGSQPGREVLGDLIICPQVLQQEARAQRKTARAHWMHLFVHGLLHLQGYDHERARDAQRMERREIRILRRFGVPNPYRSRD
jgi:probable rRNA maturation factor